MSRLRAQTGAIPTPHSTVLSEPYWEACKRQELVFRRCHACQGATAAPAAICSHCTSPNVGWETSSGLGIVYSWTTVWRPQTPEFEVPYVAVIATMDEGWELLSNLVDCEHDEVAVDMRVRVVFYEVAGGAVLPYLAPAI